MLTTACAEKLADAKKPASAKAQGKADVTSACCCGCATSRLPFSFGDVRVYGNVTPPNGAQSGQLTSVAANATQTGAGQAATNAASGITTADYSIAAAQKQAVNAWIPDPGRRGGQLFGLTPLPRYTAPQFRVDPVPGGKGVTVKNTHADLAAVVMQFLAPGQYPDSTHFSWQCDVGVDRSCYPDNAMLNPNIFWDVTQAGSDLLAAGEQEHCDDYQFAFYAVLGRAAEIVNGMAAARTIFPSEAAAKAELLKTIMLDPKDWAAYFECLVTGSIRMRDEQPKPHSWHTPLPPTDVAVRRRSRLVSRGQGRYDAYVAIVNFDIGKHSAWEVVNAVAVACNAAAQTASPRGPGRQKPPSELFDDDPLSGTGLESESTLRVRPGPMRTTLIRPSPMLDMDGVAFSEYQPDPAAWVQAFLTYFQLRQVLSLGTGQRFRFFRAREQRDLSLTEVVDKTIEQAALYGRSVERQVVINQIVWSLSVARPPGPSTSRVSMYLTFSVVRTGHVEAATGKFQHLDAPGMQVAPQVTWELHRENQSGPEFTWTAQLAFFQDASGPTGQYSGPFQLQSAYTGFQAAWVFSFLQGSLQLAPLAQALTGFARAQQTADGIIKMVPAAQISTGGQILYQIPGTNGKLQVGGQAAAAFTAPMGARATIDLAPSIVLQWKWN